MRGEKRMIIQRKRKAVSVLFFLSSLMLLSAEGAEIRSVMDSELTVRHRLRLKGERYGVFAYLEENPGKVPKEVPYLHAGLETPFLTIGPLSLRGSIRELGNPGGYSPGSPVFTERNGWRLDTDMSRSSRIGAAVQTPGKEFGMGILLRKNERISGGAWCNFSPHPLFILQGLYLGSFNGKENSPDGAWLSETPQARPGTVLHGAIGITLQLQAIDLSLLAALSASKITAPGWFFRGKLGVKTAVFSGNAAASLVLPDFIGLDGDYPDTLFTAGGEGALFPKFFLHPRGSYGLKFSRLPLLPGMFIPSQESWTLGIGASTEFAEGYVEWLYRQHFDIYGVLEGEEGILGEIKLKIASLFRFTGGCSYLYNQEGEPETSVPLELVLDFGPPRFTLKTTLSWKESFTSLNRIRFDFSGKRGGGFFAVEAELNGDGLKGKPFLSFGWELQGVL